jgi:SRSO17 transposase
MYATGLLGSAERKSVEPLAAQASGDPQLCDPYHQRLLHFLSDSKWSDRDVRHASAKYVLDLMAAQEPIRTWIIDDTGFLKQGTHSVGVQRQYTGSAGKIANCQIGVSLSVATLNAHVPIDFELYLPESWTDDARRREKARIPAALVFKTKEELAIDMIRRAAEDGIPGDIVLADSWYGRSAKFRDTVRGLGFDYALGINTNLTMWCLDPLDRRRGEPQTAKEIGLSLGPKAFRRITWRAGATPGERGKLHGRFAFRRVKLATTSEEPTAKEPQWLIIEWPPHEAEPTKFALTTLGRSTSKKQIVRLYKERYRTEQAYEELKGELGLDHFEGRSFPGWHHHISVALCCYAFVIAERLRLFPPSRIRRCSERENLRAA